MENPLVTHAKHNVWCATNQDFQHHINLPRITPTRGVLREYPVLWDNLAVPPTARGRDYFHFYQIGHLPAKTFDFVIEENKWINYMDLNVENNILIDVYLVSGGIVPRDHIWVTRLYNKNIILAVKNNFKMDYGVCNKTYFNGVAYQEKFNLDTDQAIVRFYSNAYFDNVDYIKNSVDYNQPIRVLYKQVNNQVDYSAFIAGTSAIESMFGLRGLGVYYQNGFVTSRPLGYSEDYAGSYLGFMWDESFAYEKQFPIKHLPAFISEKNRGVRKYLIVTDNEYDRIDYHDDIDFYVINTLTGQGVYLNRNTKFGLNMVTHNSYAIDADVVEGYIDAHEFLGSIDDCSIRMMVRYGGREVGLVNQKNRIEELYQLDYNDVIGAHVNTPSLVPSWRAAELEKSSYVQLMSAPARAITSDLVIDAYGYNAICTEFANPRLDIAANEVIVPTIARIPDTDTNLGARALFAYDNNGMYLGHFNNNSLSPIATIPAMFSNARTVECLNGNVSTDSVDAWINVDVSSNDLDQYGYRCYVSTGDMAGILNEWDDVTGSTLYTYIPRSHKQPAEIRWNWNLLSQAGLYPAVKCNKTIHLYQWSKPIDVAYDGCIELEVSANQMWNGIKTKRTLGLPPGTVDVFANGLSLIQDVDYFMNWPRIVIINRDINRSPTINITVRSYGFGDPRTNKPFVSRDTGFIQDGMLSVNGIYDIRNNKCIRVVVDNKLVNVASQNYGEQRGLIRHADGKPYSVSDYILPIENLIRHRDTWSLYHETLVIDESVSAYLSTKLPQIEPVNPIVNVTRWPVISPVVSSILHAFKNDYDFDERIADNYTSEDIDQWFAPFKWLLEYDPAHNNVNENYFRIEPHANDSVMTITQKQYEFLEWIILLHLNSRVDLTNNVQIG